MAGKTRNMGPKGLSPALLQMKFMQRTKTRLEEEAKKKEEKKLQKSFLAKESISEASEKAETAAEQQPSIKFENRYDLLEDLSFGRMSFKGFNPEVEKLMKYYKDLKDGKMPDEMDLDGEQDVTDYELATSVFSKKAKRPDERYRKHKMKEDEEETLIDETNEQLGKRKRRGDERRTAAGNKEKRSS